MVKKKLVKNHNSHPRHDKDDKDTDDVDGGGFAGMNQSKKKNKGPRIVDHISSSSDEEIAEDEAFNSDDERMYGALFAPSSNAGKKKKKKEKETTSSSYSSSSSGKKGQMSGLKNDSDNGSESDENKDSPSEESSSDILSDDDDDHDHDHDDDDDSGTDDDSDGIASDDDDSEGDGGQYMLDLLDKLDSVSQHGNKIGNNKTAGISKHDDKDGNTMKATMANAASHLPESEFSAVAVQSSNLTLDALMKDIADTKGYGSVQRAMRDIAGVKPRRSKRKDNDNDNAAVAAANDDGQIKNSNSSEALQTFSAPLNRIISERITRKVHYEDTTNDMSLWKSVVKTNREAETLDFRPNKDKIKITRDELVGKFVPTTDFEREVALALEEARNTHEEKETDLVDKFFKDEDDDDDLGSNKLSMEQYKQRMGQLAKMGALLFYEEQKRRYMNKIKSKKYRKIRKKQRERQKEAEMAALLQQGGDGGGGGGGGHGEDNDDDTNGLVRELQEKEEMERIKERMTLAHKNTSKWARRVLRRGNKVDTETRRDLSAQLKIGDDLRKKMNGIRNTDDVDDEDEEGGDLVEAAKKLLQDVEEDADTGVGGGKDDEKTGGLFKMSFMQRGLQMQRERAKQEARQLLMELEANKSDEETDEESDDGGDEKKRGGSDNDDEKDKDTRKDKKNKRKSKKQKTASAAETEKILPKGKLVASALEFGTTNNYSIAVSGGIDIDLTTSKQESKNHVEADKLTVDKSKGHVKRQQSHEDSSRVAKGKENSFKEEVEAVPGKRKRKKKKRREKKEAQEEPTDPRDVGGDHPATLTLSVVADTAAVLRSSNEQSNMPAEKDGAEKRTQKQIFESRSQTEGEDANPWIVQSSRSNKDSTVRKKLKTVNARQGITSDGIIDVKGAVSLIEGPKEKQESSDDDTRNKLSPERSKETEKGQNNVPKKKTIASLSQEELVRKAFAAPTDAEVEEEFEREKEAMRERDDPTRKTNKDKKVVAGWGSWAGEGAPAPRPPRKLPKKLQAPEKKVEKRKREDDNMKMVIINEKRMKRTANKYQIKNIPYPFTSREQYEKAMMGALGQEWNVTSAVREMTRPEIVTRAGKIIQPISKKAKEKRAPAKF